MTSSGGSIAATKLHIPAPRPGLVSRPALLARLTTRGVQRLTLLDAPPGYGKTTLLAQWQASDEETRAFAWLSLDREDNDQVRFWSCVIEALRTVAPGVGESALGALRVAGVRLTELVLPLLLNDLAALPRPVVLVLDDYHVLDDARFHDSVAFFVDRLPGQVHLALATRSDPPLPLGRLRARGEMTELRAADLRLTDEEAGALLAAGLGPHLDGADVAQLARRTEGWAAGLYLAALSLRGRDDGRAFVASFAGDDRQVADYLVPEVLDGQADDVRGFLLRTSVLERLCGPLCDAVLETGGSARMLERIERSNLFLVPLDARRVWYRYHALFAEVLRHELELADPALSPELHQRASAWFADAGSIPEAVHHAAAAGRAADAAELVAVHWNAYFNQGRLDTVADWLRSLGRERVTADPRLCVAAAWLAMDRGRLEEAEGWVEAAEAGVGEHDPLAVGPDVTVLRAVHSFKAGSLDRALEAAGRILELEAPAAFPLTVALCVTGVASFWAGRLSEAQPALERAAALADEAGNDLAVTYALGYLALVHAERRQLADAERLAGAAASRSDEGGFDEHFVAMAAHLARGRVAELRGDRRHGEAATARALELARRGAGMLEVAAALLGLAGLRRTRGAGAEAALLTREAHELLAACPDQGTLRPAARRPARSGGGDELTDREVTVLRLLADELSLRQIGAELFVSHNTVKTHTRVIYRKLRASSRADAVARGRAAGLL